MLFWLLLAFVAWNVAPLVVLWTREMPAVNKAYGTVSLIGAAVKGLLVVVPSFLAPFVVLVALLQTKPEDEHLPGWAHWWDNDVSINGDQVAGAETYYAPGHDRRSFWARFVWLGFRNRASRLSQMLGHRWGDDYYDVTSWGDSATGRDHEGWTVNRRGYVYQVYVVKRLGRLCLRMNFGYKVWAGAGDLRKVANVVNIAFSLVSWKGVA